MGSFAGVKIDAKNLQDAVLLAEQKKVFEQQTRLEALSNSLVDYRNSIFPDGQYYVVNDFNSMQINLKKTQSPIKKKYSELEFPAETKTFKKGEIVNVFTIINGKAGSNVLKIIKTDSGDFYADQNNLSKTKPADLVMAESLGETKKRNDDKTKLIIIGAFILGFLLSKD